MPDEVVKLYFSKLDHMKIRGYYKCKDIMRSCMLIGAILFFPASRCKNLIGYIGESVVLKSGIDQSLNLSRIEWSIFDNSTYIATIRGTNKNVDRWPPFKGRLDLDTASGDLTIKDLRVSDSMKYTVSWKGKESSVYLSVRGEKYIIFYNDFKHFLSLEINILEYFSVAKHTLIQNY